MFCSLRVFSSGRSFAAGVSVATVVLSCPSATSAAPGDIVLYASDVTTIRGEWARLSSTTGAGGQLMRSTDAGRSATAPLASPQHYIEASFDAPANTAYHIWLRLRAQENSRHNDSVMVQFSDAQTPAGSAVWRIGSTSALIVSLEECSGCGVSGWGWSDSTWSTGDYPVIKFAAASRHTLRVQTREDGVEIDQIVLSPVTYFNAAPGALKNDATIVPKSSATQVAPPEVVLYASEAVRRSGNWTLQSDSTAALGKRNGSTDYGWLGQSVSATPSNFLEWTFSAVAGTRYRTWLRLRATGNSKDNDSVWVQFAGSIDAAGVAKYRIGTTSALSVALEDCSGCGVSGWGWQRRAYWLADTGDVYFATSGTKTIRVQTREDGVNIDQIVLSPSKFLDSSPGAVRNDTTLVNRDGTRSVIGAVAAAATFPQTLTFTASADHSLVSSYLLNIFAAGANPATATPVKALNLSKPAVVGGQITAAIGTTIQSLASGSYFATVTAVSSAGSTRSAPSNTFSR